MKMNMHQENLLLPCYSRLAAVCPPPPSQPLWDVPYISEIGLFPLQGGR